MAGIIDTNILLYGINENADEFDAARTFLKDVWNSREQWYVTEGVLYEFLRVATHPRVFDHPLTSQDAMSFLSSFLNAPNISILIAQDTHVEILQEILATLSKPCGNLFFDIRTVVLMKEHGIKEIYTSDKDFLQFSNIRVIDPLKPNPQSENAQDQLQKKK